MPMFSKLSAAVLCLAVSGSEGTRGKSASFDSYVQQHGRSYVHGSAEYEERLALFQKTAAEVTAHNSKANRRWTAGLNKLSDWTEGELQSLRGWDGSVRPHSSGSRLARPKPAFLQQSAEDTELPEEKSWANLETAKHIHNQGGCGSCWAIATSTVLEYHSEIHTSARRTFSPQQIVSCTQNPRDCGGTGMCDGATAELAFDFVLKSGCATAEEVPYTGDNGQCGVEQNTVLAMSQMLGGPSATTNKGNAFGMTGWEKLPQNDDKALMQALVEKGPVAISVGASPWQSYESGVFDGCDKDSVIDHAVVLIAYGKDDAAASKYWQIQNSWGSDWGEAGHIRALRQDDSSSFCGIDNKPQEGTACKGENDPVTVCGMCGLLYDSVVPHFG